MSDVPKFVRQRAAQQAPGDHPDANLLAAFAEGGLTKGERAHVLAHLGTCSACRDVLALALPASPDAASAPAQAARPRLHWPMLRWAGAAAAVVVVAAAVMLMKPHERAPMSMRQTEVAAPADKPAAPKAPEALAAAPSGEPAMTDQTRRKDSAPAEAAREESKSKAFKKEDAVRGQLRAQDALESRDVNRVAKTNEAGAPQAPGGSAQRFSAPATKVQQVPAQTAKAQTPVSAASPPVTTGAGVGGGVGTGSGGGVSAGVPGGVVGGAVGGPFSQQQLGAAKAAPSQARTNNQAVPVDEQAQVVARERAAQQMRPAPQAAESVAVSGGPGLNKAGRAPMTTAMMAAAVPRWRVSAQGEVERSPDAGRRWQLVRVAAEPVSFRSVSSVDHDVWAGGAGGALYHSTDDGHTWTRVTVKALDMVLATDIARVEFTDAQHGTVTTTTGVTWITGDAGATWSLRANPPR